VFIGHFAVGCAAKHFAPKASLGPLLAAPLLADLLWPVFLLLGIEQVQINVPGANPFLTLTFVSYPWSHSLLMGIVWATLFGGAYHLMTGYGRGAVVIALAVVSHWVLDFVTHFSDLPLWPGHSPLVGLGLWTSVPGTTIVESLMFAAGVWIYTSETTARDRIGRFAWWGFVLFLIVGYVMNLRGVPPPTVTALAWTAGIAGVLTILWGWWADRHRAVAGGG
jgi:hypothetical protein